MEKSEEKEDIMETQEELDKLIEDFLDVARISGVPLSRHKIKL